MSKVVVNSSVSLDGYVAHPDDTVGPLFDWYFGGDVPVIGTDPGRPYRVSSNSADHLNRVWPRVGAVIIGRRLFDLTNGWHGVPAVGDAVYVVTHAVPTHWDFPDAPFTFVTDGLESAIASAKAHAGDRDVAITGGQLCAQALRAGLVDEIAVDLVPVVLGGGVRFFGDFAGPTLRLGDPKIVAGSRVTHLTYRVERRG